MKNPQSCLRLGVRLDSVEFVGDVVKDLLACINTTSR